jgi:hypothetical protein
MVFDTGKNNIQKSLTHTSQSFQIATGNKIFRILSDSIYVQKIDAVIRELCCNAYDAHIEAKQDRRFLVKLPSDLDPEFKVRDFGFGLSHEDMSMYTTYGESTKSSSNAYIGAFGIGAKSPFAYTNTFNVTSYQNGKGGAYSMFIEDGAPQMTLMGEFETEEPSGLEIFFPVRLSDVQDFQNKAIRILAFMADKMEVKDVPARWYEKFDLEVKKYEWIDAPYIGQGYQTSHITLDIQWSSLYILQGNVAYEMSMSEVSEILKFAIGNDYYRTVRYLKTNFYLTGYIRVPNGTFVPHPSRERLTFDDQTKESLKNIFSKIFQHFVCDDISSILRSVKTYYELYLALQGKGHVIRNAPQIVDFTIDNKNQSVHSASIVKPIRNFNEWCKAEFSGITIMDSQSGGYRFKQAGQLTMFGFPAERIYFTNKYPLSIGYRYRLIKDLQKFEAKKVIILDGWHYGDLFQLSDKVFFVDVQALPKLTQAELAEFKQIIQSTETGTRVTKEEVSFVTISTNFEYATFHQKTTDEVIDTASKMQVMWVGSNHRYEFPFGDHIYKLKVKGDCEIIHQNLEFYLNSAKDMIPNWKQGDSIWFGIVVLPEGHQLRNLLPELTEDLRSAALFEVREFLKVPHFQVERSSEDTFIEYLIRNPLVFDKLLEGWSERASIDRWRASGTPKGDRHINKPRIPFFLWDDSDIEVKEARLLYDAEQNCVKINMRDFYNWLSSKCPLFDYHFSWSGISDRGIAKEMIEYMKFKLGIKSNEEQNGITLLRS